MKKLLFIIFLFAFTSKEFYAQELLCEVSVVAPDRSKVKADPQVWKTLEASITEFMNGRNWTDDTFKESEKIDCSIFIAVKAQSGDNSFSGSITVISKRPAYNSDYQSTVLNIIDNEFNFNYQEFQPIEFNENLFTSNLSHVLAYYAYLIIGMDYESFSLKGGEKYLQKASDIVNVVGTSEANRFSGWKSYEKNRRNRYWMITHTLNGRYEPYREGIYKYYRLGLDNFSKDPELARENIQLALVELAKVSKDDPNLAIMQMWSETKRDELVNIFLEAPSDKKDEVINLLKKVDPINSDKYEQIKKGK